MAWRAELIDRNTNASPEPSGEKPTSMPASVPALAELTTPPDNTRPMQIAAVNLLVFMLPFPFTCRAVPVQRGHRHAYGAGHVLPTLSPPHPPSLLTPPSPCRAGPVQRGPRPADGAGHVLRRLASIEQLACCIELGRCHRRLAAADLAGALRGRQAGHRAFQDQFTLRGHQAGHDVEEEPPGRALGVNAIRERSEIHLAAFKHCREIHQGSSQKTENKAR